MQLGNTKVFNRPTTASIVFVNDVRDTPRVLVVVTVLKYLTPLYSGVYWNRFPKCGPRVRSEVIDTLIAIRAFRDMLIVGPHLRANHMPRNPVMVHKCAVFVCFGAVKGGFLGTTKKVFSWRNLRQMGCNIIQR
jgi:hypothetical protein